MAPHLPRWMFGEWRVTSRLRDFRTPLGADKVDAGLVQAAQQDLEQGQAGSLGENCMELPLGLWRGFDCLPGNTVKMTRCEIKGGLTWGGSTKHKLAHEHLVEVKKYAVKMVKEGGCLEGEDTNKRTSPLDQGRWDVGGKHKLACEHLVEVKKYGVQ
eukprot:1142153-Pelagomonas_calceolata.AAC.7